MTRHAVAATVAAVILIVVHLVAGDGGVADASFLAVGCGAAIAAWIGARRHPGALGPRLVALGVTASAAGDVTFRILTWVRGTSPDVSIAEIGWLGSYVALAAALVSTLRRLKRADVDGWIDVAVVFVAALVFQWQIGLADLLADGSVAPAVRIIWALYPVLDAALLALIVRSLIGGRVEGRAALLLATGVGCWLAADTGFTTVAADGDFSVWLNAGWMVGALALSASTWAPGDAPEASDADSGEVGPPTKLRLLMTLLPLILPGSVEVIGHRWGTHPNPVPLFVATIALTTLAFARMARLQLMGRRAHAALASRERYATAVAANSADAMVVVDAEGTIKNEALRLAALVGRPGTSFAGLDALDAVDALDADDLRTIFERALLSPGRTFDSEIAVRHRDGHTIWLGGRLVNLLDDPDVAGVVVNVHDVTARKVAEADLAHQAFHDSLTGLANRALFLDRLEQSLRRTERTDLQCAVIFLDLDGFKNVNDGLGHSIGDQLLRAVGERLQGSVRATETVARLGGDEFAVLVEQSDRAGDEAEAIAERILGSLRVPVHLADQWVSISASLGIAIGDASSSAASVLRDADVAMYQAKAGGKGKWIVYDTSMRTAVVERMHLESELTAALDAEQFTLAYQPVVELESERVVGFEALLRWHHPTLGVVGPDRFIPIAEDNGLIVPIGAWVLREACAQAAAWHRDHPDHRGLSMAVNVSARQIASPLLVTHVAEALEQSGLDPHNLVVEMTETALIEDAAVAAERLHELRDLGIRLAIDDFGTGYSSLSYLRQFPVDILKIDRSFINAISDREQVPAIVRGLLDLGRTLELETIAEGVERGEQRDRLRDEHCDLAQGYLFARPLSAEDAELLLVGLAPGPRLANRSAATSAGP